MYGYGANMAVSTTLVWILMNNLLQSLRKSGKITFEGSARKPVHVLCANVGNRETDAAVPGSECTHHVQ